MLRTECVHCKRTFRILVSALLTVYIPIQCKPCCLAKVLQLNTLCFTQSISYLRLPPAICDLWHTWMPVSNSGTDEDHVSWLTWAGWACISHFWVYVKGRFCISPFDLSRLITSTWSGILKENQIVIHLMDQSYSVFDPVQQKHCNIPFFCGVILVLSYHF
jgi:hypothetical protein